MVKRNLAVYSTVYEQAWKYIPDWFASICIQCDNDFDLWIGVDRVEVGRLQSIMDGRARVFWLRENSAENPAQIRQRAFDMLVKRYSEVVFVDCDDILKPERVARARNGLKVADVYGCAMQLIDEKGDNLGITFQMPASSSIDEILPYNNVFGMSNTAYRSATLLKCLPIPGDCVLVDWYVATLAWIQGATLGFDPVVSMEYRQHDKNLAGILPPFTPEKVILSTQLVYHHYSLVLRWIPENTYYHSFFNEVLKRVLFFQNAITSSPGLLQDYVNSLNLLKVSHIWWSIVANPQLEKLWRN